MVHGIRTACCSLLLGYTKGINRIQEGNHRVQEGITIARLIIGFGSGNYASRIILTACRSKGNNIHNRKRFLGFYLIGNQIPRISLILRPCGNGLGAVQNTSASNRKNHINILFFTDFHAVKNTGIILGIGLNIGKLINLIVLQKLLYLVIKTNLFDASTSVAKQNPFSELLHHFRKFFNHALSEDESCRCLIIKILHG